VIFGSLGREKRVIVCKSGQSVGKVVTIEATIALGGQIQMEVVLGETNKGMYGINDPSNPKKDRVFRFWSKGSSMV